MKLPLTIALVVVVLLALYLFFNGSLPGGKKYDWSLELTKPADYRVEIQNVTYYTGSKEIYRLTSMPPYTDWVGTAGGRVMHGAAKVALPDSMKISWKEVGTGAVYTGGFAFPGPEAVSYWNDTHKVSRETF